MESPQNLDYLPEPHILLTFSGMRIKYPHMKDKLITKLDTLAMVKVWERLEGMV
jgi:hypothetical protein